MVSTVTFNPALDYVIHIDDLIMGQVNRTTAEELFCGGKGINVSTVLAALGIQNRALGFIAGFTGDAVEREARAQGIEVEFIRLPKGFSRINIKIKAKQETEINGQGPPIPAQAIRSLLERLDQLQAGDMLVLAGSIPKTLPEDMYEKILSRLQGKGIRFVVDATKDLLVNVLKYRPFLIKPNSIELGEIFQKNLKTDNEIRACAQKLQEMGAQNVLVSMAGEGSILLDETGRFYRMGVPAGRVVNSVGAGDSMVAGFIYGYTCSGDYAYALKTGTAAGSATAFSPGLATKQKVMELLEIL